MTTIRPLEDKDLPAVAGIYAHYVTATAVTFDETPPELADWRAKAAAVAAAGLPFLVTEVDGEIAGYAYLAQYRPKPAYRHTLEDSIYLAPRVHRQGPGRAAAGRADRAGPRDARQAARRGDRGRGRPVVGAAAREVRLPRGGPAERGGIQAGPLGRHRALPAGSARHLTHLGPGGPTTRQTSAG
ncbi:N-acetyltransferase family protein [Nonomuraea salmonea]|uniref:GNAT family N-acetyltransferase n=1 Tax=Nonomuraea salmonea TaxID=46181 RepID=UPI003CD0B486